MAVETITTLSNALKTYYLPTIIEQLDNGSGPILAAIQKGAKYAVGNKFKFAMEYGRSGGIGARAEDGALPTPAARKYAQAEAETKNLYARMSISDKLMRTSKDSKVSFVDQVTRQMENLVIDGNDMLRRNLVGSSSGQMALVNGAVSSSTDVVIDNGNIQAFYPGQRLNFGTSTTACTVADVDYANKKIILSAATSIADNTAIYLDGNKDLELTGMEDIMDVTNHATIYGINRANNKWFCPIIIDKSSGGYNQLLDSLWLQEVIDDVDMRCGEKPNFIACSPAMQRAYVDEQNTYKRNIERMKVDGGYDLVSYNGVPISTEKYMKTNMFDFINTKYLYLGRLADWDWLSEDGAVMHRVADKAAYEATVVMYGELLCTKPVAHARLKGVAEVGEATSA